MHRPQWAGEDSPAKELGLATGFAQDEESMMVKSSSGVPLDEQVDLARYRKQGGPTPGDD